MVNKKQVLWKKKHLGCFAFGSEALADGSHCAHLPQRSVARRLTQNGRESLPLSKQWRNPLISLMLNQGQAEAGCNGFLVRLHHASSLTFSSHQGRQISQDCSIPYATGTEETPKDSRDLAEHQHPTPHALTAYGQTRTANNPGWHLPQSRSFSSSLCHKRMALSVAFTLPR